MSLRCKCPCENPINCPLKSKPDNYALLNTPLKGQVFGLAPDYPYPPFHRKKLTNREIRDAVDKNELWFYTPPWQIPRVQTTCLKCHQCIMSNIPTKKIIHMAKKNLAFNGPIGELKVFIPHFGKAKIKYSLKMKNSREGSSKSCSNVQNDDFWRKVGRCKCPSGVCGKGCPNGCKCNEHSATILSVRRVSTFNGIHKPRFLKKNPSDIERDNRELLSLVT